VTVSPATISLAVAVLLLTALPAAALPTRPVSPPRWGNGDGFLLGINYPWLHYGHDFGTSAWGHDGVSAPASRRTVESDFAYFRDRGIHLVRWFLLTDGRAAPEFDAAGRVVGFDDYFYADVDAALDVARDYGIRVVFVLLDFHLAEVPRLVNGVQMGGRANLITDPVVRRSFLDNALRPLLLRYGHHRQILAWDVVNEPEGAMTIPGAQWMGESVSPTAMRDFIDEAVTYVHRYSAHYATVGSASRRWLPQWTTSNLDIYQYHYYDHMEDQFPLEYPISRLGLDRPVLLGEFPLLDGTRPLPQYLDAILNTGHAGAFAWSYRAGDDHRRSRERTDELAAWWQSKDARGPTRR
jgi:hypothetical protein